MTKHTIAKQIGEHLRVCGVRTSNVLALIKAAHHGSPVIDKHVLNVVNDARQLDGQPRADFYALLREFAQMHDDPNARTETITVRVTTAEKVKLQDAAGLLGCTVGALIRDQLFGE